MFDILLLMALGRFQDYFWRENGKPYHWAVTFSILILVLHGVFSLTALISAAVFGLYAWGYFVLLRRLSDKVALWLLVWVAMGILPWLLALGLVSAARQVA